MIKTAGELISEAQTHINCVEVMSAKAPYDHSHNAVILATRSSNSF